MTLLTFFTASLLLGLAWTAPTSNNSYRGLDYRMITENQSEFLVVYTGEHDIVKLLVPLNALNCKNYAEQCLDFNTVIFFVQADTNEKGERVDQGLYILKGGNATKLLDNGRDAAAANDDSKTAYFAAKDGIYSYNAAKNQAEKYGSVTDSLISIAKVNGSDVIYVLTDDHVLYKVTEEGTKKEKVDKVVNAQQIVLDHQNNLYYYTSEKEVYALVGDEIKKIEGLPQNATYLNFIKSPLINDNEVLAIVDNDMYVVYKNGTSELEDVEYRVGITAYSLEADFAQCYAQNKKIYDYNVRKSYNKLMSGLNTVLGDTQSIATNSRSDLRA